jgi:hypothetical protein
MRVGRAMYFIVIFGPPAVGKMTVGTALSKLCGFPLFHNHMTIDLVLNFFPFEAPQFRLVTEFRQRIFDEVAASDLPGIIFTYVWALNDMNDRQWIDSSCAKFTHHGAKIAFVELRADLKVRLERNGSAFRLAQKPTKRDIARSRERLLAEDSAYRLNSDNDFFYPDDHIQIDNTDLSPEHVACIIQQRFALPLRTVPVPVESGDGD